MADARLRAAWLGQMRFDDLSDTAWRVFTGALMWSVENGTDGLIPARYTRYLHPDGDQPAAFDELADAEIWTATPAGFQLTGWDTDLGQSTAEQIEKYREDARERQRKRRERAKKTQEAQNPEPAGSTPDPGSVTPNVPSNVTQNVGKNVGNGNGNGNGKYPEAPHENEFEVDERTGEVVSTDQRTESWPTRVPGSPNDFADSLAV